MAIYTGMALFERLNRSRPRGVVQDESSLLKHVLIGTVAGARLGHCLFYDPAFYLQNPLEILMIWKGGLASHGAAIGVPLSVWIFSRRKNGPGLLPIMDVMSPSIALAGFFIRLGNLMNSEIIGKPTNVPWAFIFKRVDPLPRHPTQIYESLSYAAICVLTYFLFRSEKSRKTGFVFGVLLISIFGTRFLVEFLKENQSSFESSLPLNLGQILSIPLVWLGIRLVLKRHIPAEKAGKK